MQKTNQKLYKKSSKNSDIWILRRFFVWCLVLDIGEKICDAGRAVVNTAKNIAPKVASKLKTAVSKVSNFVKSLIPSKN